MASKYEVVMSVKTPAAGRGAPGAAGAAGGGVTAPGRIPSQTQPGTGQPAIISASNTLKQFTVFKQMNDNLKQMSQFQKQFNAQMKKDFGQLHTELRSGNVGGAARAAAGIAGTTSGAAMQGALAAVPIAGAITGILGFISNEIFKIGNAYIQTASKQAATAGIAGFQGEGRGMMGPSEYGEYIKELRMTSGKENVETFKGEESTTEVYRRQFGISGGEMGRTMGLMNLSTQNRGGESFTKIMNQILEQGQELQAPKIMQDLTQQMQSWSEQGIKVSNVEEFARNMITMNKYNFTGNAQTAVKIQQGLNQQIDAVHRGQKPSGAFGYRMYQEAANPEFIRSQSKVLETMGISAEDLKDLTPQKRMMYGQLLASNPQTSSKLQEKYFEDIAQQTLGNGDKYKGKAGTAWTELYSRLKGTQGYEGTTPEEARMMFGGAMQKRGIIMPEGTEKQETIPEWKKKVGGRLAEPEYAKGIEISREVRSLNQASRAAADAVVKFEESLSKMVEVGAKPAAEGIEMFTKAMGKMTDYALEKAKDLEGATQHKGGVGGYFKDKMKDLLF
jgi:hypothetical protein